MKPLYVYLLAVVALLLFGCEDAKQTGASADAISVLEATRAKMLNTPTHHYRFRSFWDNRFASSTYEDSMRITYSYLPDSDLGFGFHAAGDTYEMLYNGKDNLEIHHTERKVVRTTAADINKDSSYFKYSMSFHGDPKALPEVEALTSISDTVISGKQLFLYTLTKYHIEQDTSQIIDYFFSDYSFSEERYSFGESDREKSLAYREISEADDEEERLAGLVRVGEQLHRADYTDINDKEQLLYGKAGKKTVVMFSFIGCGGCEYALREMKKKNFALRDGVELMYSSPVDKSEALPRYFKKKTFPFVGFGKESLMNENFNVASFPTFVLINEDGGVEEVMGGYDQEVEQVLFE